MMLSTITCLSISIAFVAISVIKGTEAFFVSCFPSVLNRATTHRNLSLSTSVLAASTNASTPASNIPPELASALHTRRTLIENSCLSALTSSMVFHQANAVIASTDENLASLLGQIKEARDQIEIIPDLIKLEKWDAVRAILIKPPLSYMWTSGGGPSKLLKNYANAIGSELPNGDEIAALELREEVISHLRYLDMAVYNNVFNPIATEGTTGATKELVRSYYEDPINEWNALKLAIDQVIALASSDD